MAHLVQDWGSYALEDSTHAFLVYGGDGIDRGLTFGAGMVLGLDYGLTVG